MDEPLYKLIVAVLLARDEPVEPCREALEAAWGATDAISEPFVFLFSDYYHREMGPELARILFSFEPLRFGGEMVAVKDEAVRIEEAHRGAGGGRRWNLDPGFLDSDRFLLTSRKDAAHRIWLGDGVRIEPTLLYSHGRYRPLEWTYPDYRLEMVARFLRKVRSRYLRQRRDDDSAPDS